MSAEVLSVRGDRRFTVVDEETEKPLDRVRGLGPILVVDDSPQIAMLIAIVLREDGFAVQTAPSHEEALSKAELEMPSLVLLDAVLPTPDDPFVAALHEMYGRRVPIIVVSDLPEAAFQNAARRTEAIDAIRKPFDIDDLVVRVRRALEGVRPSHSHSSAVLVDGAAVVALVA